MVGIDFIGTDLQKLFLLKMLLWIKEEINIFKSPNLCFTNLSPNFGSLVANMWHKCVISVCVLSYEDVLFPFKVIMILLDHQFRSYVVVEGTCWLRPYWLYLFLSIEAGA